MADKIPNNRLPGPAPYSTNPADYPRITRLPLLPPAKTMPPSRKAAPQIPWVEVALVVGIVFLATLQTLIHCKIISHIGNVGLLTTLTSMLFIVKLTHVVTKSIRSTGGANETNAEKMRKLRSEEGF